MHLLEWVMLILAAGLYLRYGAGLRQRITHFVQPNLGSGLSFKRILASLAIALLLGAGSRYMVRAILPGGGEAERTVVSIGPDGAKAELAGGASLIVPADSLEKPATIILQKHDIDQTSAAPQDLPPGALYVYEVTPNDATVRQPIELNLPVPENQVVSVFVTVNGQSRILPSTVTGQTARVSINSFDFNQPGAINVAR